MKKEELIKSFEKQINKQNFVMMRVKNSIELNREQDLIEAISEEGSFSKFFYDDANEFQRLLGTILYNNIDKELEQRRVLCRRIYNIYITDPTEKKIKFRKLDQKDIETVKNLYNDLINVNANLEKHCDTAISRLHALSSNKFY